MPIEIPDIKELDLPKKYLTIFWISNIFSKKDEKGRLNEFVNCWLKQDDSLKDALKNLNINTYIKWKSVQVLASYIPHLLPGTIWYEGKFAGHISIEYNLTFTSPDKILNRSDLIEIDPELERVLPLNLGNKSFNFLGPSSFKINENNFGFELKGLIIARSEPLNYYLAYSDNMQKILLENVGDFYNVIDFQRSRDESKMQNKKVVYFLNTNIPDHDDAFWVRIVHNNKFYRTAIKSMNDYYTNSFNNKANTKKGFLNTYLESNFPFEGKISIKAYCRIILDGYVLLDTITFHEGEWDGYQNEEFLIFKERSGQIDKNIPKEDLIKSGHQHRKSHNLENEPNYNDDKGYDSQLKHERRFVKSIIRHQAIPKGKKIEKKGQDSYNTKSSQDLGTINEVTTNQNRESHSNVPKMDVVRDANPSTKNFNQDIQVSSEDGTLRPFISATDKLEKVKTALEIDYNLKCEFRVPYQDKFNDHKVFMSVFPIKSFERNKTSEEYKFCSQFKVTISESQNFRKRNPSKGWGVVLRGVAILEIPTEKGFFYLIEIEPSPNKERQFKTFLISMSNFLKSSDEDLQELLFILAKGCGIEEKLKYSKSKFDIRTKKISPDLTEKEYALKALLWINSIR